MKQRWYQVKTPFKHGGKAVKTKVRLTPGEAALLQRQGVVGDEAPAPKPAPEKAEPNTGAAK
jgi:hypothetical protein